MKRVAILISGRGSNMVSLLDSMEAGDVPARCVLVLSNVPGAQGLSKAAKRGIRTIVVDHRESSSREEHDRKTLERLKEVKADVVCLAGYMRVLSPIIVDAFRDRLLNIHPALLPSFPGLQVQRKALEHGVRFSGCTVHLVDENVDHGPIILQACVPILPEDDEESLGNRILRYEHRAYPLALRLICEGKVRVDGKRAKLLLDNKEYQAIIRKLTCRGDEE